MANKTTLKPITECANDRCSHGWHEGSFVVVTIATGANVGDGSGLIQLIMCSPCAAAMVAADVAITESVPAPVVRLAAAIPDDEPPF